MTDQERACASLESIASSLLLILERLPAPKPARTVQRYPMRRDFRSLVLELLAKRGPMQLNLITRAAQRCPMAERLSVLDALVAEGVVTCSREGPWGQKPATVYKLA